MHFMKYYIKLLDIEWRARYFLANFEDQFWISLVLDPNTLPAKIMEYFLFQRYFAFLYNMQGASVLEIHSYEQIIILMELIST